MNADLQGVADRIEFRQADGLALAGSEKMHLIVANPPYIPTKEILTLQPEVRDFDPHMALDGGKDGLHYYRILALESQESLVEGCSLLAEFGDGQKNYINNIFHNANWKSVKFASDLSRKPRIVIASASL
jgi:release factor glutamine methyltransferase